MILAALLFALSPLHQEWGTGPVQWIMTSDEQRQWSQLTHDDEAEKFIALFWARRDPTPSTPVNEFKAEFDQRVSAADERFADRDAQGKVITRGAMSDRGRAFVILGFPQQIKARLHEPGKPRAHEIWVWEKEVAQQKFDAPRIEVAFYEDIKGVYHSDRDYPDLTAAVAVAMKKMIVSPDLKEVPAASPVAHSEPRPIVTRKGEPGAHHLVVVRDPNTLMNSDTGDPFANIASDKVFTKQNDLAYAFEYCGDKDPLKLIVAIRGMSKGKKLNISAPPEDVHADPMTTVPGCGMVRAAISLSNLPIAAGTYTFAVKLDDGTQSYNLSQEFKVE